MSINLFDEIVQKSMMPPARHLNYADLPAAESGVITLASTANACELAPAGVDGVIEVHPVNSDTDKWYLMPLKAGERNSCLFDQIRTSGTTVTLSDVTFFIPCF